MGRLPRPTGDDLIYHAINRGNNRADVLGLEGERDMFLGDLARTKARYPFALFGYCLMSNHFHLLLKPAPGQSISRILQPLTVAHTGGTTGDREPAATSGRAASDPQSSRAATTCSSF